MYNVLIYISINQKDKYHVRRDKNMELINNIDKTLKDDLKSKIKKRKQTIHSSRLLFHLCIPGAKITIKKYR